MKSCCSIRYARLGLFSRAAATCDFRRRCIRTSCSSAAQTATCCAVDVTVSAVLETDVGTWGADFVANWTDQCQGLMLSRRFACRVSATLDLACLWYQSCHARATRREAADSLLHSGGGFLLLQLLPLACQVASLTRLSPPLLGKRRRPAPAAVNLLHQKGSCCRSSLSVLCTCVRPASARLAVNKEL